MSHLVASQNKGTQDTPYYGDSKNGTPNNRKPTFQLVEERNFSCSPFVGCPKSVRMECINLILHTIWGHRGTIIPQKVQRQLLKVCLVLQGFRASGFRSIGFFATTGRALALHGLAPHRGAVSRILTVIDLKCWYLDPKSM